jgi:SAM-dependent methyltransferase
MMSDKAKEEKKARKKQKKSPIKHRDVSEAEPDAESLKQERKEFQTVYKRIRDKQVCYRMSPNRRSHLQSKFGHKIEGFGYSHKPSGAIWKTAREFGYIRRVNRMLDMFEVPKGIRAVADIGCGPWGGVFFARKWPRMYAVDPSWTMYEQAGLVRLSSKIVKVVEDYAQTFILPEFVEVAFSVNAVNHSGDLQLSIANTLKNLEPDGLFFLHVNLRSPDNIEPGHPMPLDENDVQQMLQNFDVLSYEISPGDPMRPHAEFKKTLIATIKNSPMEN